MAFDWTEHPHRRFNPLTREWILVSPHRAKRPWLGQLDEESLEKLPAYDPDCYLCPGNSRAGGIKNPEYTETFVFDNDFPALLEVPSGKRMDGLLQVESESGVCRVVCFSPRHDLALSQMEVSQVRAVVDVWVDEFARLGSKESIRYVQIFENRGAMMGCSNPHPHCQIWASQSIPNEPSKELTSFEDHLSRQGKCLLCDYMEMELRAQERHVLGNRDFTVVVPFWAVWPFETLVCSNRHCSGLDRLTDAERDGLAEILSRLTGVYDRLFSAPFPYSMGFHQRPTDGREYPGWHFHAHFYPPLLRSANIRKFMVGYELLATPQRDITPESAAERLRELAAE